MWLSLMRRRKGGRGKRGRRRGREKGGDTGPHLQAVISLRNIFLLGKNILILSVLFWRQDILNADIPVTLWSRSCSTMFCGHLSPSGGQMLELLRVMWILSDWTFPTGLTGFDVSQSFILHLGLWQRPHIKRTQRQRGERTSSFLCRWTYRVWSWFPEVDWVQQVRIFLILNDCFTKSVCFWMKNLIFHFFQQVEND